jgi:hypothetical protein
MENQETMRTMTVQEVLEITRDMLERISVPAGLIRQIGEPVAAAIDNLNECLKAMERDEAARRDAAAREDEDAGAVPLIDLDAEEGKADV